MKFISLRARRNVQILEEITDIAHMLPLKIFATQQCPGATPDYYMYIENNTNSYDLYEYSRVANWFTFVEHFDYFLSLCKYFEPEIESRKQTLEFLKGGNNGKSIHC